MTMNHIIEKDIIKQAEKILNKKLKGYHILTTDGINLNITNGINNYSTILDKDKNITYITLL